MKYLAALMLTALVSGCALGNSQWAGSPDLVPNPPAWTQADQTSLEIALGRVQTGEALTETDRLILGRAVTEYGALRQANREARETLAR